MSAARNGEAFDTASGLPVSMRRADRDMPWYEFACAFVDMKWPHVAATTRRTHAEALMTVTMAMFANMRGKASDKLIRSALVRWGFNTSRRNDQKIPADVAAALRWVEGHTRPISAPAKPDILRFVLDRRKVRLIEGSELTLAPVHAKVRRDGYHRAVPGPTGRGLGVRGVS